MCTNMNMSLFAWIKTCYLPGPLTYVLTALHREVTITSNICDPVQQKGHDVGQVYSEIMSKTVCKI